MSKRTAGSGTATGCDSASEGKEKLGSDRMYLHDAFCSNVWTWNICNVNSTYP